MASIPDGTGRMVTADGGARMLGQWRRHFYDELARLVNAAARRAAFRAQCTRMTVVSDATDCADCNIRCRDGLFVSASRCIAGAALSAAHLVDAGDEADFG